jgi:hypothetical protein
MGITFTPNAVTKKKTLTLNKRDFDILVTDFEVMQLLTRMGSTLGTQSDAHDSTTVTDIAQVLSVTDDLQGAVDRMLGEGATAHAMGGHKPTIKEMVELTNLVAAGILEAYTSDLTTTYGEK